MRRRLPALLAVVLMTLTACANVPLETKPQAIRGNTQADQGGAGAAQLPEKDISAGDVVRAFVENNAQEADGYAVSKQYLDPAAAKAWQPDKTVVILKDDFNTIPEPADQQPDDPNQTRVRLDGEKIGSLGPDDSFIPASEDYRKIVTLKRQPETDQWRITDPPDDVMTVAKQFDENYFAVRLYYFAPGSNVPVPDLRYIAAEPAEGLAGRVMDALLLGPSNSLLRAVDNPLSNASIDTNVRSEDSALEVPLTGIAGAKEDERRRIVAQVVLSLQNVAPDLIRLLSDGKPLLPDRQEWRIGDLENDGPAIAQSSGMAVENGRVVSLASGREIPGPAGTGVYQVESAAQSIEGGQLALVQRLGKLVRLRVGPIDKPTDAVDIRGTRLTRPTWQPAYPGNKVSSEVWTVVDGKRVVRAQLTQENVWTPRPVDSKALEDFGRITALRLSRDGTRAAIVANERLVVAAVERTAKSVKLRSPRILQPEQLSDVVDVDWSDQDKLVVATSGPQPVVRVTVDGYQLTRFNQANLESDVTAVSAMPGKSVFVANASGVWTATDPDVVWRQQLKRWGTLQSPFYPG